MDFRHDSAKTLYPLCEYGNAYLCCLTLEAKKAPSAHKTRTTLECTPGVTHGTQRTQTRDARNTTAVQQWQYVVGDCLQKYKNNARKKGLGLSTTLDCPRKSNCSSSSSSSSSSSAVPLVSIHVSHNSRDPPALQIAGSDTKNNYIEGSRSNTARTNYHTRAVLLPALLASGRRV